MFTGKTGKLITPHIPFYGLACNMENGFLNVEDWVDEMQEKYGEGTLEVARWFISLRSSGKSRTNQRTL